MRYSKPKIINLGSAAKAFQGNNKRSIHLENVQPFPYNETVNAYESDE